MNPEIPKALSLLWQLVGDLIIKDATEMLFYELNEAH